MRVLIFGGDGMLGHRLLLQLAARHETRVTLRQPLDAYHRFGLFDRDNAYDCVDVREPGAAARVVADFAPDAVVNAVGIVKQRKNVDVPLMEVNALFPHLLARVCRARGARLAHLSTDCVFSGKKGNYAEGDGPDPEDTYGFSKLLGEVEGPGLLTLRTSMIGPELHRKTGLVEWFLAQEKGKTVMGWRKAVFSGFTTRELARLIETVITAHPYAGGIYHASAAPITKHDLLTELNARLRRGVRVVPDDAVFCDRSLDSSRFRAAFGYAPPSWDSMLGELTDDIERTAS